MNPHTTHTPTADASLPWTHGLVIPLALNLLVPTLMIVTGTGSSLGNDALPTGLTGLGVMALTMVLATAWQQRKRGDYSARMRCASCAIVTPVVIFSVVALVITFKQLLFWYEAQLPSFLSVRTMTLTLSELLLLWASVAMALPLWRQLNDRLRARALRFAHIRAHGAPAPRSLKRLLTHLILPIAIGTTLIGTLGIAITNKAYSSGPCSEVQFTIFGPVYSKVSCSYPEVAHPVDITAHGN